MTAFRQKEERKKQLRWLLSTSLSMKSHEIPKLGVCCVRSTHGCALNFMQSKAPDYPRRVDDRIHDRTPSHEPVCFGRNRRLTMISHFSCWFWPRALRLEKTTTFAAPLDDDRLRPNRLSEMSIDSSSLTWNERKRILIRNLLIASNGTIVEGADRWSTFFVFFLLFFCKTQLFAEFISIVYSPEVCLFDKQRLFDYFTFV